MGSEPAAPSQGLPLPQAPLCWEGWAREDTPCPLSPHSPTRAWVRDYPPHWTDEKVEARELRPHLGATWGVKTQVRCQPLVLPTPLRFCNLPWGPQLKAEPGDQRGQGHRRPRKVTVPTGAALRGVALKSSRQLRVRQRPRRQPPAQTAQARLCPGRRGELAGQLGSFTRAWPRPTLAPGVAVKRAGLSQSHSAACMGEIREQHDTPCLPSFRVCQSCCQRPCGERLSRSQADLGCTPTLPFLADHLDQSVIPQASVFSAVKWTQKQPPL